MGLGFTVILLMISPQQYLEDPKQWESWHLPLSGYCRLCTINRSSTSNIGSTNNNGKNSKTSHNGQ